MNYRRGAQLAGGAGREGGRAGGRGWGGRREEGGVREELSLSSLDWAGVRRRKWPKFHCWVKVKLAASVSGSALSWCEVSMVEVSRSLI